MIVCMSRRICVELYNAIIKRMPNPTPAGKRSDLSACDAQADIRTVRAVGSLRHQNDNDRHVRTSPRAGGYLQPAGREVH